MFKNYYTTITYWNYYITITIITKTIIQELYLNRVWRLDIRKSEWQCRKNRPTDQITQFSKNFNKVFKLS